MFFEIITLFPEYFTQFFRAGLMGKSVKNGVIRYRISNLRKYGLGKYRSVDDTPYGGGAGMLLTFPVASAALRSIDGGALVYPTPRGRLLCSSTVKKLLKSSHVVFFCGHYEGMDERIMQVYKGEEISIGDYVLSGGEPAAAVIMDAVARHENKFMGNCASLQEESFMSGRLEYDQYTKPEVCDGVHAVPKVLTEGNHASIHNWQKLNSLYRTWERRSDLFKKCVFCENEQKAITSFICTTHKVRE